MTRTTRILTTAAATLALLAGTALAQGPRFGGTARGTGFAAQNDQVCQRSDVPATAARPARAATNVQAQRRLPVADATVGPMHAEIAEALGITDEELSAMHAEGLTLFEIAESLGVDLADLPVGPAQAGGWNTGRGQAAGPQSQMQRTSPRGWRN